MHHPNHSTNEEKTKTQIICKCEPNCSWEQKTEIECQGPCRHQTALYPKVNYFFKIIRDFSSSDKINRQVNSILVSASVKATTDTTPEDGWTYAIRFK